MSSEDNITECVFKPVSSNPDDPSIDKWSVWQLSDYKQSAGDHHHVF